MSSLFCICSPWSFCTRIDSSWFAAAMNSDRARNRFRFTRTNYWDLFQNVYKSVPLTLKNRECLKKFGRAMGKKIFQAVNICFDSLPLCAVVGTKVKHLVDVSGLISFKNYTFQIFCVHGGIPRPGLYEKEPSLKHAVAKIPVSIDLDKNPDHLAWNLLWNEPIWLQFYHWKTVVYLIRSIWISGRKIPSLS